MKKRVPTPVPPTRDAVIVDGVRTPFLRSNGAFKGLMAHDLGRHALAGLLAKTGMPPAEVDLVVMGCVVQDPRTTNVAREAMLGAGVPATTPALTTTLACVSANVAATIAADKLRLGAIDTALVGGTESFSDPPIRLSRELRQALVRLQKAKGAGDWLAILMDLSPEDLIPDIPSAAEFSTGLTMGESCERLARRIGVTRADGDAFAVRSHVLASRAWSEGRYDADIVPVPLPPRFELVQQDDGPRGDSTVEALAKLRPAFDKEDGSITAASSSFLTDGASAVLLMARERAATLGMQPLAVIRDQVLVAGDPLEELLLGPALAIPALLERHQLVCKDIGVWEIHEAFAAQVVACLRCLGDAQFLKERVGYQGKPLGAIPLDLVNVWGGSLSIGHPFGATGGRLLTTAARRLVLSGARYAVVAGCAAGGHGSAILLENAEAAVA